MAVFPSLFSPQFPSQPVPGGTTVATTEFPKELAPFIKDILEKAQAHQKGAQYQPYTGPQIAPFNPAEQAAMAGLVGQTTGLAGTDIAQAAPYFTGAKTAVEGLGQQFTGDVAQQYMNPYQQAVVDQAKAKATEDYESRIQPTLAASAIKHQPFGGSRQAITEGMAQGDYLDRLTDIQERGLAGAYQQGRAEFQAQKARESGMANQLMGMGQQIPTQALRDLGIQQQVGEAQRMQDQTALDLGRAAFMEEREFPTRALQEYAATVRGIPFQPSTYQTQTAYQATPSVGQQLMQLGMGGLGAWTQFSGQPLGQTLGLTPKATGGLVGLPMVSNQAGENRQMREFPGADMDLEIYKLYQQDPETAALMLEEAQARKDAELAREDAEAMADIEYQLVKQNKGYLRRALEHYIPSLRTGTFRAEGGLAGLPVVYRDEGTDVGSILGETDFNLNKVLDSLGIYTPSMLERHLPPEEQVKRWEEGGKKGPIPNLVLEQMHSIDPPAYDSRGNELDYDQLNMMAAQAVDPTLTQIDPTTEQFSIGPEGVVTGQGNIYLPEQVDRDWRLSQDKLDEIKPSIVPQRVDQADLKDHTVIDKYDIPDIIDYKKAGEYYGEPIADSISTNELILDYLNKMTREDGSIPELKESIRSAYTPERLESLKETAKTNLAMKQGKALWDAAAAMGDPNKSFVQNLVASGKAYTTGAEGGEDEYAKALADIEQMPFEEAQALYNVDKDTLTNMVKLASDEKSETNKLHVLAKSEDYKNLFNIAKLKYERDGDKAKYETEVDKINLLADLQSDDNILKLYKMELIHESNHFSAVKAAEAAIAKHSNALVKAGIIKASESKDIKDTLATQMFGAIIDPATGTINQSDGVSPLTMDQRIILDRYYSFALHRFSLARQQYLGGETESDEGFSIIGIIAQRARNDYLNESKSN